MKEYLIWWYWSRFPLFYYWMNQRCGDLWRPFIAGTKSEKILDFMGVLFLGKYYKTLDRMIVKTGRNLYNCKIP